MARPLRVESPATDPGDVAGKRSSESFPRRSRLRAFCNGSSHSNGPFADAVDGWLLGSRGVCRENQAARQLERHLLAARGSLSEPLTCGQP